MNKILSVIAIAAFATSGAVFAQKVEPVWVHPALPEGAQNRVYLSTEPGVVVTGALGQAVTVEPQVVTHAGVLAFVEPGPVLVGNVKGPIKLGGPKYDPLGRKIYAPRAMR